MAVIKEPPPISDDEEFDVVEPAQPVSDLSSPTSQLGPPPHHYFPSEHYGRTFDGGQSSASDQRGTAVAPGPRDSLNDSYAALSSWMAENDSDTEQEKEKGSSALRYTKSVMQRFWPGQEDLLIAIMGYVILFAINTCCLLHSVNTGGPVAYNIVG